jgi:hypothetical protein
MGGTRNDEGVVGAGSCLDAMAAEEEDVYAWGCPVDGVVVTPNEDVASTWTVSVGVLNG